jgi:hypothetical protein
MFSGKNINTELLEMRAGGLHLKESCHHSELLPETLELTEKLQQPQNQQELLKGS